ncbi:hypothetical protein BC830DRAFT_1102948 [Chytriomyces sp. MP71]|nr:hypothetical protein BC830DRAFT_1102948 [Chytriomyces sp. MP71]
MNAPSLPMPFSSDMVHGLISVAFFPAAWVFVHFLMVHKNWCFADFCVESMGSRRVPVRQTLSVFYSFLIFTALVAFASKKLKSVKSLLSRRVQPLHMVTIGEVAWFSAALFLSLIAVPAMVWAPYWNMWASMLVSMASGKMNMGPGMEESTWPWIRVVYETLILTTGDSLSLLLGFVVLPISKYSFLASFLDLPYNSTLRVHMWLGYAIFWLTVFHLILCMLSYVLDQTPLYDLFFTVPVGASWGNSQYLFITGFVSFFILGFVLLTSLSYVRRKAYYIFFVTHFLVFVAVLFAYFHASMSIFYMIPGLGMYAVDGFLRLQSRFSDEKVVQVKVEVCGYITVTVATQKAAKSCPGQFMRVNVPSASRFEFHPWSIVHADEQSVSFLFAPNSKANTWSSRVADLLKNSPDSETVVHMQGPFGKEMELTRESAGHDLLVFYVAGTGIAACVAGVEQVLKRQSVVPKIQVYWSSKSGKMETLTWIQTWLNKSKEVHVQLFETNDGWIKADDDTSGNHRPNLKQLLAKNAAPLKSETGTLKVGVFVCGPNRFARDALESVDEFVRLPEHKGIQVSVEVESFDL